MAIYIDTETGTYGDASWIVILPSPADSEFLDLVEAEALSDTQIAEFGSRHGDAIVLDEGP